MARVVCAHLRAQLQQFYDFLERTMDGVDPSIVNWQPPGTANSIGANYAHLVFAIDRFTHQVLQEQPTIAAGWADRCGITPPPPAEPPFHEWLKEVQVVLGPAREYARAVYRDAYTYLDGLQDEQLADPIDLTGINIGVRTVGWAVDNVLLNHTSTHHGEISCLKGLAGTKGYAV